MKSKSSLRRTQKKANTCRLTITNIETYCLTRVTWEEVKPILSKREIFDDIRKSNPAVEKLRTLLDLQLT